jgi:hypothetical protein
VVAIFGKTMVEGEPPPGRAVATAAASCGCCVRPLAWNLPPGSISTDSTTTAPAIGFGADGCDSTTVGLPGVMSATTGYRQSVFDASVDREPGCRTGAACCRIRCARQRSAVDRCGIGSSTRSLGRTSQSRGASRALGLKERKVRFNPIGRAV